ncbi:MAG: pseudouridine synthase [Paracoccaceae bacterium]|nr:pseudouridine synthase [Paracoccaceae bacterium]
MSDDKKSGDRIAKVMARAGIASRRDAERMIIDGRVAVNGVKITSPALDVQPKDKVTLDGKPIDAPQPARLWLYYKPLGLVTSEKDEKGRQTVFDTMPEDMPRVMSVGRLDLNSEGLLLLTNDGELKRRLELPSTGWLRKYRVRINGRPNEATFDPLRRGVTIDGENFLPMDISLDKQQGANAWLTVGLREGKNREIRRAMAEVGLIVNRLIRVSYGPFRLNKMKPGDVIEVKQRVLRDQLGRDPMDTAEEPTGTATRRPARPSDRRPIRAGGPNTKGAGDRRDFKPRAPRTPSDSDDRKPRKPRSAPGRKDAGPTGAPTARQPRDSNEGPRDRWESNPRPPRRSDDAADRKPRTPRAAEGTSDRPRDGKTFAPRSGAGDASPRNSSRAPGSGKTATDRTKADDRRGFRGKSSAGDARSTSAERPRGQKAPWSGSGKPASNQTKPRPGPRKTDGSKPRGNPGGKK